MFAGTALAIEAVDAKRAAAAKVLTVPIICSSWGACASAPHRYVNAMLAGQVPALWKGPASNRYRHDHKPGALPLCQPSGLMRLRGPAAYMPSKLPKFARGPAVHVLPEQHAP
jgi:hypothetical protein